MARIAIVDDDPSFREDLSAAVNLMGHETTCLDNCRDAFMAFFGDPPDLVILDVMFPEGAVAGFDLARKLRMTAALKDVPILLFTNVNTEFPLDFSPEDIDPDWMPVQDFMDKSAPLEHVLRQIARLLAQADEQEDLS